MPATPVARPGGPAAKVDARSERWREHRVKVRDQIVDAAFRAIDRGGPDELREMQLETAALELAAAAALGSASAATDCWLGPGPENPPRMPAGEFVAHLTTIMLGTVSGTADLLGVDLDPDLPIGRALPRAASGGAAAAGVPRHA